MKEMQDAWNRGDRGGLWECPDCGKILTEGSKKTHPDSCSARKAKVRECNTALVQLDIFCPSQRFHSEAG